MLRVFGKVSVQLAHLGMCASFEPALDCEAFFLWLTLYECPGEGTAGRRWVEATWMVGRGNGASSAFRAWWVRPRAAWELNSEGAVCRKGQWVKAWVVSSKSSLYSFDKSTSVGWSHPDLDPQLLSAKTLPEVPFACVVPSLCGGFLLFGKL